MTLISDIQKYARSKTRNNVVFCPTRIEGLSFRDIGFEFSSLLQQGGDKDNALRQLMSLSEINEVIGKYLAIDNIGILFEPCLNFNIEALFEQHSNDKMLVVCAEGHIDNNVFFFRDDNSCKINLQGLSYIQMR